MDGNIEPAAPKKHTEAILSMAPRCTAVRTRLCRNPQQLIHVHLSEVQTCRKDNISLDFDDT